MSSELLKSLGLDAINAGTYLGNGEWSSATSGELITPVNPTTGEPIAQVRARTSSSVTSSAMMCLSMCVASETAVSGSVSMRIWSAAHSRLASPRMRPCAFRKKA